MYVNVHTCTCTLKHASTAKLHTLLCLVCASFKCFLWIICEQESVQQAYDVVQVVHIRVINLYWNLTTVCDICWSKCSNAHMFKQNISQNYPWSNTKVPCNQYTFSYILQYKLYCTKVQKIYTFLLLKF